MFITGQHKNTIDDKGRLMIPSKVRSALGEQRVYLAPSFEGDHINLYTETYFENTFKKKLFGENNEQLFNPKLREAARRLIAPATLLEYDASGRLNLPQSIRALGKLNLKDEVLILGMGDFVELWNPEKYEEFLQKVSETSIDDLFLSIN